MRHRFAALLLSSALTLTISVLLPSPARAEVDGVDLEITKLPDEFAAGDDAATVEVVVSTDNEGRCQKVRWSMLLTVAGVDLDQVEVDRVEDNGSFPLQVSAEGDTVRLTDVRFDPGSLCRGRTVTARYQVSFAEDAPEGEVTFNAQAFDANQTLLQQASASSKVEGDAAPSPSPSSPSPSPSDEETEAAVPPPADDSGVPLDPAAAQADSTPSLLGAGLIVGAVLVFLGVGLLLRIRLRNKKRPKPVHHYPGYMRM